MTYNLASEKAGWNPPLKLEPSSGEEISIIKLFHRRIHLVRLTSNYIDTKGIITEKALVRMCVAMRAQRYVQDKEETNEFPDVWP